MKRDKPGSDDLVFQKLRDWIKVLENQAVEIHEQRVVFEEVKRVVHNNPEIDGNVFFEHLNSWYSASVCIAIRRLVDPHKDAISYVNLLNLIKKNPRAISRDRIIQAWGGHPSANDAFNDYAGVGEEFLPVGFIDADLDHLVSETKIITDFTSRLVAHNDKGTPPTIPRFADLSVALNRLEETHKKYAALLTGYSGPLTPSIIYPWINIFRIAWIQES